MRVLRVVEGYISVVVWDKIMDIVLWVIKAEMFI